MLFFHDVVASFFFSIETTLKSFYVAVVIALIFVERNSVYARVIMLVEERLQYHF